MAGGGCTGCPPCRVCGAEVTDSSLPAKPPAWHSVLAGTGPVAALAPRPGGWQGFASSRRMRVLALASDVFAGGQLCGFLRVA